MIVFSELLKSFINEKNISVKKLAEEIKSLVVTVNGRMQICVSQCQEKQN